MSVSRSCAPGWGRSLRAITGIPGGRPDRSNRSVSSATQAPSRTWSWASGAGVHTDSGILARSSGVESGSPNPTEYGSRWLVIQSRKGVGRACAVDPDQHLLAGPSPALMTR